METVRQARTGQPGKQTPRGAKLLATIVTVLGLGSAMFGIVMPLYQLSQPGGSVTGAVLQDPNLVQIAEDELPGNVSMRLDPSVVSSWSSDRQGMSVAIEVSELPAGLRMLTVASTLVAGLLLGAGSLILRRVLIDIADGRPFAPGIPARINVIALLTVALAIVPQVLDNVATVAVLEHVDLMGSGSGLGYNILELNLGVFVVAGLVIVVARVFQHGQRLSEDVEGLV